MHKKDFIMMYTVKICLRVIIVIFFAAQCDTVGAMKGRMLDSDLPLKKRKIRQPLAEDQETLLIVNEFDDETDEEWSENDFESDVESERSSSDDDSSYEPEDGAVVDDVSYQGTCHECNLMFDDPSLFYLHLKAEHIHQIKKSTKNKSKKGTLYRCDICDKNIANVCNHLYTHHIKFRRFVCPWCGDKFYQPGQLLSHKSRCADR